MGRSLRVFFFSSRRRHTRFDCDWSSDVCSSDLPDLVVLSGGRAGLRRLRQLLATIARICGSRNGGPHLVPACRSRIAVSPPAIAAPTLKHQEEAWPRAWQTCRRAGLESSMDKRDNGAERVRGAGPAPSEKGEWSMRILNKSVGIAAILASALVSLGAPRAAAQTGSISGQILDVNGKPWAELTVQATSDQGAKQTAKTDNDGKYSIPSLRPGIYTVTITGFPPPNDKQPAYDFAKVKVGGGEDAKADANFKEIMAKQGA